MATLPYLFATTTLKPNTGPAGRPDLVAHREALRLPIPEIVKQLVGLIGRQLTAYVGGVRDVRALDRWINGSELYGDAEQRFEGSNPG